MNPRISAWIAAAGLALAVAVSGCSSCKRNDEPSKDPKFDPSSDASARPVSSAKPAPTMTPMEAKNFHTPIEPELCTYACKRVNELHGRVPEDKVLLDLVSACLRFGNNAWYGCILEAKTGDDADLCSKLYLRPADEPPAK